MQFLKEAIVDFFEYKTPKIVHIKNKKIGALNRLIQVSLLIYIICYAIVWKKGYQDFDSIESSVSLKVKGIASTNFSEHEFNDFVNESVRAYYNRVWDISDVVVPPSENGAFFITTNLIITPNQTRHVCAEDPKVRSAHCTPKNNTCVRGRIDLLGNGPQTGECVLSDIEEGVHVCQIEGWCPVERDELPLKNNTALLKSTNQFTVLINNAIKFPKFGVNLRNIPKTSNATYLKQCRYNVNNKECPVFILNDIVESANLNYDEVAKLGAVIAVDIKWDCNLDWNLEYCKPEYSFRRLDDADAILAPGWNFRYSQYYNNNLRTLYKAVGIKFVVIVRGTAGKFNIIPLFLNVGSGLGLLAITTIICDLVVLYCTSGKDYYKNKKYLYVEDVMDGDDTNAIRKCRNNGVRDDDSI